MKQKFWENDPIKTNPGYLIVTTSSAFGSGGHMDIMFG